MRRLSVVPRGSRTGLRVFSTLQKSVNSHSAISPCVKVKCEVSVESAISMLRDSQIIQQQNQRKRNRRRGMREDSAASSIYDHSDDTEDSGDHSWHDDGNLEHLSVSVDQLLCSQFAWKMFVPSQSFDVKHPLHYLPRYMPWDLDAELDVNGENDLNSPSSQARAASVLSSISSLDKSERTRVMSENVFKKVRTPHWSLTSHEFETTSALLKYLGRYYPVIDSFETYFDDDDDGVSAADKLDGITDEPDTGFIAAYPVRNSRAIQNIRSNEFGLRSYRVAQSSEINRGNAEEIYHKRLSSLKVYSARDILNQLSDSDSEILSDYLKNQCNVNNDPFFIKSRKHPKKKNGESDHSEFMLSELDSDSIILSMDLELDPHRLLDFFRNDILLGYFLSLFHLYRERVLSGGAKQGALLTKLRRKTKYDIGSEHVLRRKMRNWNVDQQNEFMEMLRKQSPIYKCRRCLHGISHVITPSTVTNNNHISNDIDDNDDSDMINDDSDLEVSSPVRIVKEDKGLYFVEKPAGLPVSFTSSSMVKSGGKNLVSELLTLIPQLRSFQCSATEVFLSQMLPPGFLPLWLTQYPGLLNKADFLERKQSGLMVVGKDAYSLNRLFNQRRDYHIERHFTILVHGSLPKVDCFTGEMKMHRGQLNLKELVCFDEEIDEILNDFGEAMPYGFYVSQSTVSRVFDSLEGSGDITHPDFQQQMNQHMSSHRSGKSNRNSQLRSDVDSFGMSASERGLKRIFGDNARSLDQRGNANGDLFWMQSWIAPKQLVLRSSLKGKSRFLTKENDSVCLLKSEAKSLFKHIVDKEFMETGRISQRDKYSSNPHRSISNTKQRFKNHLYADGGDGDGVDLDGGDSSTTLHNSELRPDLIKPSSTMFTRVATYDLHYYCDDHHHPTDDSDSVDLIQRRMHRFTLIEATAHTLRMNQLRLHLNALGLSIVGDNVGRKTKNDPRTEIERRLFGDLVDLNGCSLCHCHQIDYLSEESQMIQDTVLSPIPDHFTKVIQFCQNSMKMNHKQQQQNQKPQSLSTS